MTAVSPQVAPDAGRAGTIDRKGHLQHEVLWQSIVNAPTGYATSCREILYALETAGVRCSYSYVYGKGTPLPNEERRIEGDEVLRRISERRSSARIAVVYGQGDVFERNRGAYRIGFTMLETDRFPKEWVRQANLMDEVWTPTHFNRDGLIDSGVTRPVHVIPLGINPRDYNPQGRRIPNPRGDFVFLSNVEWGDRKYPELLLKVFNGTFHRSEPVVLVCRVINRDPSVDVREAVKSLRLRPTGGRIVFLYNRVVPHEELAVLYRSADCYVSAGRAEGWDLPLMEAMACGLPAIATDWGGHREYLTDKIAYPLRSRGAVPAISRCSYYDGARWADPDPEHLRHLLRHVYSNRGEAGDVGKRAAEVVSTRWTWARTAAAVVRRLDEIDPGKT